VTHTLRSEGFDASEDGTGRGTPLTVEALSAVQKVGRSVDGQTQSAHARNAPAVGGEGGPGLVRRLTPSLSECEQLQGFPRGWTLLEPDTDWRDYPQPDGRRYAACGDAVTVPVAFWIGRRLMERHED
jgi:DNA (cytosine-5)-methyltransferase 1